MSHGPLAIDCRPAVLWVGAFLAALALAAPVAAVAPPPAAPEIEVPGPGPLFLPNEFHTDPLHMALTVVGASSMPRTGLYSSVAALYAGEQTKAWNLEGALTNRYSRVSLAAATLVLNGTASSALTELVTLKVGEQLDCWVMLDTDVFRALPPEWLAAVGDGPGIPIGGLEAEIYARVLVRAYYTSLRAFARATRRDVTYSHVMTEPERYRGTVVRVEGRLLRVNRYAPPPEAEAAGVSDLFEAWVFNEQVGTNPYCLVFSVWPPQLSTDLLGQPRIQQPVRVVFDGFFFKSYNYKSKDRHGTRRDAPLIVGHTLIVESTGAGEQQSSSTGVYVLLYVFVGVVISLIFGIVGLTYWYRRADRRLLKRLQARMPAFVLPPPDVPPVAPPTAPPVTTTTTGRPRVHLPHQPRITFPGTSSDSDNGGSGDPKDKTRDEGAGA